jgi:microcystin-dependent protein
MSTFQRGDKNIANASGQVVREDMEDTLKATAANNFGPLSGAGTILPAEFVADNSTTPKRLLIRATSGGDQALQTDSNAATFYEVGKLDQANLGLLPIAGGTMTGQLLGNDGSLNSSPAYSFNGDTDTGMFRNSANTIGFSTAAVERAIIDASGLTLRARGDLRLGDSDSSHYIGIQAPATVSSNITFTAPVDGTNGQVLQTNGSGVLSFATFGSVPVGAIFCMPETAVPSGYVECNGQSLNKTQSANTALFNLIQYKYGGSGNNFNVPDLRGQFVRGVNTSNSGTDSNRGIGSTQGSQNQSHNHSYGNNGITVSGANHNHSIRRISLQPSIANVAITLGSGQSYQIGYATNFSGDTNQAINTSGNLSMSGTVGITINNTGGNESRPRNVAMMYIIRI